ncbi:hypothetical protein ACU4HD_33080 [Cupriavidus basilensis]
MAGPAPLYGTCSTHAGAPRQHLAGQVAHGAVAGLGDAHIAVARPGRLDEVGQRAQRRVLAHHQHHGLLRHAGDRREILQGSNGIFG